MTPGAPPSYNTTATIAAAATAVYDAARVPEDNPMVKVKGPLLSQDATGKLGNDLQLSHWKGRNVLGRRRRPSQPRTEPQQAHRIFMGWLASQWKELTPQQRVTWEAIASVCDITPYNAFVAENMHRANMFPGSWQAPLTLHAWPTKIHPTDELLMPADLGHISLTDGGLRIKARYNVTELNDSWGFTFHHGKTYPEQFRRKTMVHAVEVTEAGWHDTYFNVKTTGLQYYAIFRFSTDGRPHTTLLRRSVIVTPAGSPPDHTGPPQDAPPPPIPF